MAARSPPQLPASRRSEPTYREQRRQKVEEYLSRKKTFSGVPIQENKGSIRLASNVLASDDCSSRASTPRAALSSPATAAFRNFTFCSRCIRPDSSRTRRATTTKLQDKILLSTSPKPEMENKENTNELSWDQSSGTSEKNVILNSSTITVTNSISGTKYNPEDHSCTDEVTEVKSQQMSLTKSFLQIKSIKEKRLIAEKENSTICLPKKPVLGTYRGKVIQSKINSFRKAPRNEGEKSSLLDKKLLPSSIKPAAKSVSTSTVLKTIKGTNNPNSVKPKGVLPFQSKPSDKAAINSQSSMKKWQLASAVVPKKVTGQKMIGGRGSQPPKATSNNSDRRALGGKKCADFCEDARFKAPAKPTPVVPGTKLGWESRTNGNRKSILPKESAVERRARLDEWRASRGKVMRRPPISVLLGPQSKSKEQEFSSADSLEDVLNSEKIKSTLAECLQLIEQSGRGDEALAMLEDLTLSIPGAKKLAKYWICCMRLKQKGPLEKLIAVYEEAILAGAMPKDELRHTLIDAMKNTESFKSEDVLGEKVTETHLSEVVEVSKEPNSSVEHVQVTFKDLGSGDQKAESDDKQTEISSEVIKKEEMDLDFKPREETLPKKTKKRKTKEHTKKRGKSETEEQNEDEVKHIAQAVNSPEKENDTSHLICNPSTTPYVESVKMQHEANDSSAKHLKIVTPLRYSQRIREKMCKLSDTVKDQDPCEQDSFEQLGELETKATAFIHKQSNGLKETSAEVEE